MNYKEIPLKQNRDLQFKNNFIPEINQKSYQSRTLLVGEIIKITKTNIYFDVGLKSIVKTRKKNFLRTFFEIEKLINQRYSGQQYSIDNFLKSIKIGNKYKLVVYQIKSIDAGFFIDFEKTKEHIKTFLTFYELDFLKRQNQSLYGYILNSVNGGFSVGINGLVAFVPNNKVNISVPSNKKQRVQKKDLSLLNTSSKFKILNINFDRRNVILTKHNK